MGNKAKFYKMNDGDPTSVRLDSFPVNSPLLKTDADGNPTKGNLLDILDNGLDVTWDDNPDNHKARSTIIQLTGRGASLVEKDITGASHSSGDGINGFTYGRGCTPGYVYKKNSLGVMTKTSAWIAQSSNAEMYLSFDKFSTVTKDTSLSTQSDYVATATFGYGAQCLHYGKIAKTDTDYAWIVFKQSFHGFFYVPDVAESYNDDGTFKSSAWVKYSNANISDAIAHSINTADGATLLTAAYMEGVAYYADLKSTGSVFSASEEISGIAADSYGTYLTVARNSGILYRNVSEKTGAFDNTKWVALTSSDKLKIDGVAANNLPITGSGGGLNQTWWAGLGCSYGLWVCTVALKHAATDPIYAYSDDGINWFTYGGTTDQVITVWDMKTDGAFWFGCPTNKSEPLVYQILVNSIPAHKRLIAEKGLLVVGDAFLQGTPNADFLSTDINGKVSPKTLPKGYEFIGTDVNGNFVGSGLSSPFSQELFPFALWKDKIKIHNVLGTISTVAYPFIAARTQNISKIKIAVGTVGAGHITLALIDGSTRKIIAITESKSVVGDLSFINNFEIKKVMNASGVGVDGNSIVINGAKLYYLAISTDVGPSDQTSYYCVTDSSIGTEDPRPTLDMVPAITPNSIGIALGSGNTSTSNPYRPWMAVE